MSGDIQPRKRRGKAKKKDEAEEEIVDVKSKAVVNNNNTTHKSSSGNGGGSEGSGIVAKIIFLILLVSLSVVIGLILIELRGKQVGMDTASVVPKAEEQAAPEIPTPSLHVDEEPSPEPPAPTLEEAEIEDFETLEATPPLEEYIKVVEEKVEEPTEEEEVIEEVIEIVEEVPVEIVEEIVEVVEVVAASEEDVEEVVEVLEEPTPVEEVEESAPVEEESAPVEEVEESASVEEVEESAPVEEVEESASVEEVEELAPVEEVEEPAPVEEEEEPTPAEQVEEPSEAEEEVEEPEVAEEEVEEAAEAEEEAEEPAAVEEVEESTETEEEVEEPAAPVEDVEEPVEDEEASEEAAADAEEEAATPVVEEPVVAETIEEVEAPLEQEEESAPEEAPEEEESVDPEDDEDRDDELEDDDVVRIPQVEEDDDEEDWSQYGKEGGAGALTDAYLRVESLAEEVLQLDPENSMVNHLAPHLSGVLRAMEEGRTEGLLDTLSHIQVILEDVKKRIEEESIPAPAEAPKDARSTYEKADITSDVDYELREDLDAAEKLISENLRDALNAFGALLQNNPKSARAVYGRAMCLDRLAEVERSNSKLEQAIVTYRGVLDLADQDPDVVPLPLLRIAAEKCIDRMRFRGFFGKAVRVQQRLLQRFPDDLSLRNQMGVTFLLMNQPSAAKDVFETILGKWPEDGFAQVHYGFILKTTYNNNTGAMKYLKKGIDSQAEGTQDGRFYLHLGDALQREGMQHQAYEVYDAAVEKGLFLNRYQRSLYNVDRLASQPLWSIEQTTYKEFFRKLEANWEAIRDEGVALLSEPPQDGFTPEAENLQDTGDWKQYALFTRGRKITANCVKAKVTCSLIEDFAPAAGCKRGQVKFSVMEPDTHVHPHSGPTNCRLRSHLGLVVPSGVQLRVAENTVQWEEGKFLIFDDSWEHEVWHNGSTNRLVLIVDVWHPDLTEHEKKTLSPI